MSLTPGERAEVDQLHALLSNALDTQIGLVRELLDQGRDPVDVAAAAVHILGANMSQDVLAGLLAVAIVRLAEVPGG